MNVLLETVNRIYGNDLTDFQDRWKTIEYKKGLTRPGDAGGMSFNPLDLLQFLRMVYLTMTGQQVPVPLQTLLFLQLEQDFVQNLGFLLFDLNNRLAERGIGADPTRHAGTHAGADTGAGLRRPSAASRAAPTTRPCSGRS